MAVDLRKIASIDWQEIARRQAAQSNTPVAPIQEAVNQTTGSGPNSPQVSLSTEEILAFDRQRAAARSGFAAGTNNLNLSRTRAETDFGRTAEGESLGGGLFGDAKRSIRDRRESLPNQFVGRGLINSGVFKNALNRHFTTGRSLLDDLEIQFTRTFADFDSTEEGLGQALEKTLADIESDQQLRRSVYAQLIRDGGN